MQTRAPVRNEADRGGRNDRGTIAMARTSDPHSATAQFFINVADNDFLNHKAPTPQGWGLYGVRARRRRHGDGGPESPRFETGSRGPFNDVPKEAVVIRGVRIRGDG